MQLADIPRVRLAHLPTPLEPLPRLSAKLGGPQILVKRDDQTGLALGGNKARKLEFLVADALAQACDTLVTTGGPQSNHARQTAAAAARLGLHCELVLPRVVPWNTSDYEHSGNVLLDQLLGAQMSLPSKEEFSPETIPAVLDRLRSAGRRPYSIPIGGSTPLGALGYVVAIEELLAQLVEQRLSLDAVVVATGSGGTHAGILAGLSRARSKIPVQGFAVSGTTPEKQQTVAALATQALALLAATDDRLAERVHVDDRFVGPGYGLPTDAMKEAVRLAAEYEGLLIDPVYTGKALAGLIAAIRAGRFTAGQQVLFWHTGGSPALFAYREIF